MVCFSIILHTFAYIRLKKPSCHDNQYSASLHKKRLMKAVGAHTPCSCGYMQDGELYFYTFGMPKEPSLWYVKQK